MGLNKLTTKIRWRQPNHGTESDQSRSRRKVRLGTCQQNGKAATQDQVRNGRETLGSRDREENALGEYP